MSNSAGLLLQCLPQGRSTASMPARYHLSHHGLQMHALFCIPAAEKLLNILLCLLVPNMLIGTVWHC